MSFDHNINSVNRPRSPSSPLTSSIKSTFYINKLFMWLFFCLVEKQKWPPSQAYGRIFIKMNINRLQYASYNVVKICLLTLLIFEKCNEIISSIPTPPSPIFHVFKLWLMGVICYSLKITYCVYRIICFTRSNKA